MPRRGAIDPTAVKAATKIGVVLTPDQIAASGTEHAHQTAFQQWIAVEGRRKYLDCDMLFAVPNGGDRSMSVAAAMKAEGVKSGVPDMVLPIPAGMYPGLYIELKRPGLHTRANGARSDKQVEWHKRLRSKGYAVVTAYGWIAAKRTIELYYAGALIMPDDGDALPVVE